VQWSLDEVLDGVKAARFRGRSLSRNRPTAFLSRANKAARLGWANVMAITPACRVCNQEWLTGSGRSVFDRSRSKCLKHRTP
jgi:hypothetical protein